jgi:hypothetical protein
MVWPQHRRHEGADHPRPRHPGRRHPDLPREARLWALAAHRGGFHGILYRLNQDPDGRRGLALFYEAGEHKPPNVVAPQPIVVGARRELHDLLGYRGDDPLAV